MAERELRVVIADDEPMARRGVALLLAPHRDVRIVAECGDGLATVHAIETHAPDLVFLDVRMPELDGFGVIAAVGPARMPAAVFLTAFDDFAVRAFEVDALDYLVKPFSDARFAEMLARARARLSAHAARPAMAALLASVSEPPFVVRLGRRTLSIPPDDVDWIEAQDYYAVLHTRGAEHLVRESIRSLAARLDRARFVRVHRSVIVNVQRVRELVRGSLGDWSLRLTDGAEVPISRRRHPEVARLFRGG